MIALFCDELGYRFLDTGVVYRAITLAAVMRGLDPRDFALMAYGGAGPLHATAIAEELGMTRVLVPPMPANFSAFGLLVADLRRDGFHVTQASDVGQWVAGHPDFPRCLVSKVASYALGSEPLHHVDTYQTVHQMVSGVHGRTRDGTGLIDVLAATFPPASRRHR